MLRRKPTALTVTAEDIAAFEETYLRKLAYAKYLKTGEDPEGWFRNGGGGGYISRGGEGPGGGDAQTMSRERERDGAGGNAGAIDPNDELKPLPGDKARIVRSREERILGGGTGGGGGSAR